MNKFTLLSGAMMTGAVIAAVSFYFRRSRTEAPQQMSIYSLGGIGLVIVAVALSLIVATIDRRQKLVEVGGRSFSVVAPSGFVIVGPELPELLKDSKAGAPENAHRIVTLIPEEAHKQLVAGFGLQLQRILFVDVKRSLELMRLTLADFSQERERARKILAYMMAAVANKEQLPEIYEKLEALGRPLSDGERESLNDFTYLPAHRDTERVYAWSSLYREKRSSDGVVFPAAAATTSMVLVNDVVIHLTVVGNDRELEWTHLISDQWAEAILAANAH
jgi:hypothetical protein